MKQKVNYLPVGDFCFRTRLLVILPLCKADERFSDEQQAHMSVNVIFVRGMTIVHSEFLLGVSKENLDRPPLPINLNDFFR